LLEIRFHGAGGHGAVVASKFLAEAAARSGFQAQSFASYGARRRGGKVESYVRISDEPVPLRCKMYTPDCLVLMEESFVNDENALDGIKEKGKILINTAKTEKDYASLHAYRVFTVDAYGIANEKGLVIPGGLPVINTTLLGALAGILDEITLEHLIDVIKQGTPSPDKNAECAMEGYRRVTSSITSGPRPEQAAETGAPERRFPSYDPEKMTRCHRCQICYISCPTLAISFKGDPIAFSVNKAVCNACGICIEECPRKAISWGAE
jgi:pyruvate ferredoxin oxidoreductase gamma subunit